MPIVWSHTPTTNYTSQYASIQKYPSDYVINLRRHRDRAGRTRVYPGMHLSHFKGPLVAQQKQLSAHFAKIKI